ncbi:MAG: o-succinylbenzoate synthase [Candidatus Neomarinimicrobiota bacterium]
MDRYQAEWKKITFQFKRPSGTSRGILSSRESWFLSIRKKESKDIVGVGECAPLLGLSRDSRPYFEDQLTHVCKHLNQGTFSFSLIEDYPAIKFGVEMALQDLVQGGQRLLYVTPFTTGFQSIPINGLVWMGSADFVKEQISNKVEEGFTCIKMKIGALPFEDELDILRWLRSEYDSTLVELRVDANGAFNPEDALTKIDQMSIFDIHSVEQPLQPGNWKVMANLCKRSPIAIGLDEELIGIDGKSEKIRILTEIAPHYIILKPTLLGGFSATEEWIDTADSVGISWWITSALESNIGLNALAQWSATLTSFSSLPQGLGTGQLFSNNFPSPLNIHQGTLQYDPEMKWDLSPLLV